MTKKDYAMIADALKRAMHAGARRDPDSRAAMQWREVREVLADDLQRENPRFNRERFYDASEAKK